MLSLLRIVALSLLVSKFASALPVDTWWSNELRKFEREPGTFFSRGQEILGQARSLRASAGVRINVSKASDESKSGRVEIQFISDSSGEVVFEWDGGISGLSTSSLGLGCVDLEAETVRSFILKDMLIVRLANGGRPIKPTPIEIEIQAWSGRDATAQRYSKGVVRRMRALPIRDFIVPFSTLTLHGAHGAWSPSCLGALRLTVRSQRSSHRTVVSFGALMAGVGSLPEPVKALPTPIPTALNQVIPSVMPTGTPTVAPTVTPTIAATVTATSVPTPLQTRPAKKIPPAPKKLDLAEESDAPRSLGTFGEFVPQ